MTVAVFAPGADPRRITARARVKFTMARSGTLHHGALPLRVDTATVMTAGHVAVNYHELRAFRTDETNVSSPPDPRFAPTCAARLTEAGSPNIRQESPRANSDDDTRPHEILPWGCHYRSRVSQSGLAACMGGRIPARGPAGSAGHIYGGGTFRCNVRLS